MKKPLVMRRCPNLGDHIGMGWLLWKQEDAEPHYLIGAVSDNNRRAENERFAHLFRNAERMEQVLREKLPCTLSNKDFADDLSTIADVIDAHGYNETAQDLRDKVEQLKEIIKDLDHE